MNISIRIRNEKQNRMSFLFVQIICDNKTFTTCVYDKPNFSGFLYTFLQLFIVYLISLALFTQSLIDTSEYAQVVLSYILN